MKVKHIITTCGAILSGLIVARGASAVVKYQTSSDVQFTFNSVLSLTLTSNTEMETVGFVIEDLAPRTYKNSNTVTATVNSNSSAGYVLSARVGDGTTYTTSDLVSSVSDDFAMIASTDTALSKGKWGYTLNGGTTYGALSTSADTILNMTKDKAGTAASDGYSGTQATAVQVGAWAADDQLPGEYNNVIVFKAVSNVAARTVTLAKGDNVDAVSINGDKTSGSYEEGTNLTIAATCASGYTFSGWNKSGDYGSIADATAASTTYTVGAGNATLTAYCLTASS